MAELGLAVDPTQRVLAALMQLAEVSFEPRAPSEESTEGAAVTAASEPALDHAARLLETPSEQLRLVLTQRSVQAGGRRATAAMVPLSCDAAALTRDALAKKLYSGLFDRTVERINAALGGADGGKEGGSSAYIGLLDVFGFEIFETNGFEQLMVNLANERLQRFFLDAILFSEQAEYTAEALPWIPIVDVPDNAACIAAIEAKPHGVLPLLDEQCRLGDRGTDAALCRLLNEKNPECAPAAARFKATQRGKISFRAEETFIIDHFVESVTYTAAEFLERNRDSFFGDIARAIAASSSDFVRSLLPIEGVQTASEVHAKGSGRSYHTVATSFTASLAGLLDELGRTDAGFVRCIKPNEALRPGAFKSSMVLRQLRACGMVQAVKMMMSMFGARIPYDEIAEGWAGLPPTVGDAPSTRSGGGSSALLPESLRALPPREMVTSMCRAFDVSPHEYALGRTKLFFRAGLAVGLNAFCKEAPTREDAVTRAVVLRWKLSSHLRERRVANQLGAWLLRARTARGSEAKAMAARAAYVQAAATTAATTAATVSDATDISEGGAPGSSPAGEGVDAAYLDWLALRYRAERRAFAVACVQARAATRLQKIHRGRVVAHQHKQARAAAPRLQRAWRRKHEWEARKAGAIRLQARARMRRARHAYHRERNAAFIETATPHALSIQKWWRGTAAHHRFKGSQLSALVIQSSYRMARTRRFHRRLLRACLFLKQGGVLSKYRQKGSSSMAQHLMGDAMRERHDRYVRLSPDLSTLIWFPVGHPYQQALAKAEAEAILVAQSSVAADAPSQAATGGNGSPGSRAARSGKLRKGSGRGPAGKALSSSSSSSATLVDALKDKDVHELAMSSVSAVSDGAKTALMKKMKERETSAASLMQKAGLAAAPKGLELSCAFSILSQERSLDFVAPSEKVRDAWLTNLNLLLVNRATLDTATVMGRGDVVDELRAMSEAVASLQRKQAAAMTQQARHTLASRQSMRQSARMSVSQDPAPDGNGSSIIPSKEQGSLYSGFM